MQEVEIFMEEMFKRVLIIDRKQKIRDR